MEKRRVLIMSLFVAFIIPLLSFILQSYPRIFNKYFGVDVWTRLLEIEHVKKAGHKIPGKISQGFIIDGYFDYPIVFPWIFSFFSKKTLLKIQGFISPFFDVLQNILVFFVCYYLTGSIEISLIAQLIYMATPILPIENSYMTPRSLGYLFFSLSFLPIFLYHTHPNLILIIISVCFTSLLYLTHRFALQSLIIISIFFSLIDNTSLYFLVLFLGFILATLFTKGYYLRVANGHLHNIYFWIINYRYRFAHQIHGNKRNKKLDWVGKIYSLMSIFSPILLFSMNIWAISGFLYWLLIMQTGLISNTVLNRMSIWIVFFYIFGVIVLKVKRLIPIGEGQRYLEMATVPSSILSAVIISHLATLFGNLIIIPSVLLLLGNIGLIIYIQIKGIIADKNRTLTSELIKMYGFINKLPGRPRIMCIPHQITTMTVYNTKADILVNADNKGLLKIDEFFPILKISIDKIQKKYNLDYVLLRENFASQKELNIQNANVLYKSGDIILIKLKKTK